MRSAVAQKHLDARLRTVDAYKALLIVVLTRGGFISSVYSSRCPSSVEPHARETRFYDSDEQPGMRMPAQCDENGT